jgi:superfamily II DNA or RNA helicase
VRALLAWAERGPVLETWAVPSWLLPHQVPAAKRIAAILHRFGGALLSDAVGMGKTYVALAVATRYRRVTALVPAAIATQWRRVTERLGVACSVGSHESLSRGARIPPAELIVVDEAHRMRNAETLRYDRCARDIGRADVLLVTATPLVNRTNELARLLRLFLPDNRLGFLGVPSLEGMAGPVEEAALARAVTRLSVARPGSLLVHAGVPIPAVTDSDVVREPTVEAHALTALVRGIDGLTLPGMPGGGGRHLLRAHLVHRLASSSAAFRETLRRHLAYIDRIIASDGDGALRRRVVRNLLGPGDALQFELQGFLVGVDGERPSPSELEDERGRLLALLGATPRDGHPSPKADRLRSLLEPRRTARTIVFTASAATALDLARRLEWREVGVVAAGRARIASGPIGVDAVLDAFAPRARAVRAPTPGGGVQVLIATDLASEGLDLQDADTIVHYDLPWTPLRLAQRVGRIARLGALHEVARVIWFAPPPEHERRIRLGRHLAEKVRRQLSVVVPQTSRVGQAQVVNAMLETRERLCRPSERRDRLPDRARPVLAVVRGPAALAAAVCWRVAGGDVPETLVLSGDPPVPTSDYRAIAATLTALEQAPPSGADVPAHLISALFDLLRHRLRLAGRGPVNRGATELRRLILAEGGKAGRRRDATAIDMLDRALDRLATGCTVGAERELSSVLRQGADPRGLRSWVARHGRRGGGTPDVRIVGVLAGDGNR